MRGANRKLVAYLLDHGAAPLWREPSTGRCLHELVEDSAVAALLRLCVAADEMAGKTRALLDRELIVSAHGTLAQVECVACVVRGVLLLCL